MNTKIKKLISAILTACMVLAVMPVTALKLITHNPASGIRLGKSPDPVIRFYEADQLKNLIDTIADEGSQIVAPVILAAYYGLRREEAFVYGTGLLKGVEYGLVAGGLRGEFVGFGQGFRRVRGRREIRRAGRLPLRVP